jgi:putative oxidoreductase
VEPSFLSEFLARLLICALFLWSGLINKPANVGSVSARLKALHFPFPTLCTYGAIALEVLGSAVLLLPSSIIPRPLFQTAIVLMALYTVLTAVLFHGFWKFQPPERSHQTANFLKNVGLLGAFILLWNHTL